MSKLGVIEVFASRVEAELARGYLETLGINSHVVSDDADQLYPSIGIVKGIKLIAAEKDLEKAREFLKNNEETS